MTLVEKLGEKSGRAGDYKWQVQTWRSDTRAVANLRLRKRVYRVHERGWWPSDRWEQVYSNIEITSTGGLEESLEDAVEDIKALAQRFDNEKRIAGMVDVRVE